MKVKNHIIISICFLLIYSGLSYLSVKQEAYIFRRAKSWGETRLKEILSAGGTYGSIVIDVRTGAHIARLTLSGNRILHQEGMTSDEIIRGIEEGRYRAVSHQELVNKALEHRENCVLVFTGGGDAAGINAVISSAVLKLRELRPDMTILGIRNAGSGLIVPPEEFPQQLVIIDELLARDVSRQGSTFLGSSRKKPFKEEHIDRTMENIKGFGGWLCTGGDDNLKTAREIAEAYPDMVVIATAKTIDGDVVVNGKGVQCLGFHTASQVYRREIYSAAQSARTHGEATQPMVMIIETFGRDTGRLAFESARPDKFEGLTPEEIKRQQDLADSILIVVPEHPVTIEEIAERVKEELSQQNEHDKSVTIVVAEGYRPKDEPGIIKNYEIDHAGHRRLAGIGPVLEVRLQDLLGPGYKVRHALLNYEGRGALPSEYDVAMGTKIGIKMAELLAEGVRGGKFVGYLNDMNPFTQDPVVLELAGISDENTLDRYPLEVLRRNNVILEE